MNAVAVRAKPWLGYAVVVVALTALRLCWLNAYPLNSDEAQHAHVAWAWTQQLLLYRDIFDNHGPLFGLLYSYAFELIGERQHVLTWLRLGVQPWYALSLLSVWWMGRRLYGSRVALAAVLIAGLFPRFFLVSGQFRTDDMWAALWLASLATVVGAPSRHWRWLLAGALAGTALSVSQKTVVLLVAALVAAVLVYRIRPNMRTERHGKFLLSGLAGLLLVPMVLLAWLHAHHDLASAWYGLAGYNMAPAGAGKPGSGDDMYLKLPLLMLLLAAGIPMTLNWLRRNHDPAKTSTAFLALYSTIFLLVILLVWPLVTRQDPLPVLPTLILAGCGFVVRQSRVVFHPRQKTMSLVGVVTIELCLLLASAPPWVDQLAPQRAQLSTVLHYTNDTDTVMDAKSGAIFRMRPYYPVIESLAERRLKNGLMPDTISDNLVAHHTMLVIRGRLPPASDAFVLRNYLYTGNNVWIAGRKLYADAPHLTLHVELPGDYTLVDGVHAVPASLDGSPTNDHWQLSTGDHQLTLPSGGRLYLVWTQAWDRGWRPGMRHS
jgi:4-amino-4-deoxy-L-arabinose transferase-like glycosyltransferase